MSFDHLLDVGEDTGVETIPVYPGFALFCRVSSRALVEEAGGWRPVGTDALEAFAIGVMKMIPITSPSPVGSAQDVAMC